MKTALFKKGAVVCLSLLASVSMLAIPASAAPLAKDPPKGYATKLPGKSDAGVLTYQDFESDVLDSEGQVGKFSATEPDDTSIPAAKIEVVSGVSHSGSKSLKVSARGVSADGSPMGYNTVTYRDIGVDIAEKFVKDSSNANKTEAYFVSAWVRNVDPSVTQYFWLQLQYGGSGEVWLPGQTYFEVKGDSWTQIGISVVNGKVYYLPFIEDSTKSGIYAPRATSTWSALKFITKNPKANPADTNEKIVQTNGDFYIDDIVIWKVDDASQLLAELPKEGGNTTVKNPGGNSTTTKAPSNNGTTTAPAGNTVSTDPAQTTGSTEGTESAASGNATSGGAETTTSSSTPTTDPQDKAGGGLSAGAIVGIVIAVVAVLGGGGFALYWFKLRKR